MQERDWHLPNLVVPFLIQSAQQLLSPMWRMVTSPEGFDNSADQGIVPSGRFSRKATIPVLGSNIIGSVAGTLCSPVAPPHQGQGDGDTRRATTGSLQ